MSRAVTVVPQGVVAPAPIVRDDTYGAVGVSKLDANGCIDPGILDAQYAARTLWVADGQSVLDYIARARATGRPQTWQVVIIIMALAYAALGILGFVFGSAGRTYELYSSDVDAFGNPDPEPVLTFYLDWFLPSFAFAMAITYIVAAAMGVDYLAAQMMGRGELATTWVANALHTLAHLAAALLYTEFYNVWFFFALVLGVPLLGAVAYSMIGHHTHLTAGWSSVTLASFVGVTALNVVTAIILVVGLITADLEAWQTISVVFVIIGMLAFWANVLAWIMAPGSYRGVSTPRDRIDMFSIISMIILLVQATIVHSLYIHFELSPL